MSSFSLRQKPVLCYINNIDGFVEMFGASVTLSMEFYNISTLIDHLVLCYGHAY